jgi:hypothetical protein
MILLKPSSEASGDVNVNELRLLFITQAVRVLEAVHKWISLGKCRP